MNLVQFKDLNLEKIDLKDDNNGELTIVPVFTLNDSETDKYADKKLPKIWSKFDKEFGIDNKKGDYVVAEDINIDQDDESDDPFKDKNVVVVTNLSSLREITPNKRDTLDFGLRLYDSENPDYLQIVPKQFEKDLKRKVNSGLEFDEVEETYNELQQKIEDSIHQRVEREREKEEAEKRKEEEAQRQKEAEEQQAQAEEGGAAYDDGFVENDDNTEYVEPETEEVVDESNAFTPQTEMEELSDSLYQALDSYIPRIDIESVDDASEILGLEHMDDDVFYELKRLTTQNIESNKQRVQSLLDSHRNDIINTLYRKYKSELWQDYIENDKLLEVESKASEFYPSYLEISKKYEETKESINQHHNERIKEKTDAYKKEKARVGERAKLEAEQRFERDNYHLIQEEAHQETEDDKNEALAIFEENVQILRDDATNTRDTRFYRLVDQLMERRADELQESAKGIKSEIDDASENISQKANSNYKQLDEQIRKLAVDRLNQQKDLDNSKQQELDKLRLEYEDMQKRLKRSESELDDLKDQQDRERRRYERDLRDKDDIIQSKDSELKRRNQSLDDAAKANEQLRESMFDNNESVLRHHRQMMDNSMQESENGNFRPVVAPNMENGEGNPSKHERRDEKSHASNAWIIGSSLVLSAAIASGSGLYATHQMSESHQDYQQDRDDKIEQILNQNHHDKDASNATPQDKQKLSDLEKGDKVNLFLEDNSEVEGTVTKKENGKVYAQYKGDTYELSDH